MLNIFFSGAISMGCVAIALFFFRFWRHTGDRFFVAFAGAFSLLAIERILLVSLTGLNESAPYTYLVRLCAFVLIGAAVIDKNRQGR